MAIHYEAMIGWFEYTCDDCGKEDAVNADSFKEGLEQMRAFGWKTVPEETANGRTEWFHYCNDCK